mgnify:FL=1
MAKKPETIFKERVLEDLKTLGNTWFVKVQMVAVRGIPDVILCINGNFIAIELKDVNGKLDPLQEWNLNCIARAKGIGIVTNQKNWKNTFDLLKDLSEQEVEEVKMSDTDLEEECKPVIVQAKESRKKH